MLKVFKKHGKLRSISFLMSLIAIILVIITAFIDAKYINANMILKLIGLLLFVVGGLILAISSKEHRLSKSLLVIILTMFIFSWVMPYGYFQGADFYDYGMRRIGIIDLSIALYNALYYSMDKLIYLIVLAGFYGVLSKISGYQKMVTKLADKCKKHVILTATIMSVFLFVATSLFAQTFMVLLFVPFLISILLSMKVDKLSAFAITFGSVLVGILGATFGTEGITSFNYYIGTEITVGLTYRYIIAAVALVLYNFFISMRLKKVLNDSKKKDNEAEVALDPFEVEPTRKKTSVIPVAIILGIIFIVNILCYIAWNTNFGIEIFDTFHEWLTGLAPTEDFFIMSYVLGENAKAFGNYTYVFALSSVLVLFVMLLAYLYKMSVNEFIESFYNGMKKMFKPILYVLGVYLVFGICYNTPIFGTITNWMLNLVEGFNPFLTSFMAFITSLFYNDLGFTSFSVGGFLTAVYANNIDLVHVIYTSMYGIVQLFMPTSCILVLGLSLMKLDYKSWLKYIWLFVVGMIVILLVLFTVVTYI